MQSNLILMIVVAVLVLGLLAWLFLASRRTRVDFTAEPDEGPARRNQALIDAPPAAPPPVLVETGVVVPPVPIVAGSGGDDLTRLKGVGPKLAEQLRALGVTSFAQVAAWNDAEIDRIDARLGRFQGRIRRDDWREQARLLAAGDTAGYQAKFGRL